MRPLSLSSVRESSKLRLALWLSVFLLLGWLYRQSTDIDINLHLYTIQQFEQLKLNDARLNQYVLQSRYGQLKNYDPIVSTQQQIAFSLKALQQAKPDYFDTGNTPVQQSFMRYRSIFQHKSEKIEDFKSHNAVLRKTIAHFIEDTNRWLENSLTNPRQSKLLHQLLENILLYDQNSTNELRTKIEHTAAEILKSEQVVDNKVLVLLQQAAIILSHKTEVDNLVRDITQSETAAQGDTLFQAYRQAFSQRDRQAAHYKLAIVLLSAMMLAYVAWTLMRLRRARSKLAQSLKELEFQKFAMDQHSLISIADRSGKIIYTNDKFSEVSLYSREELLGQDHRLLNSGYHPHEFFKKMWAAIEKGQVWHGEIKNRRKDGSHYWVDSTIVPFMDEHGKPLQYASIRTDITANKELGEAVVQQRAFYERISETLGEGLYVQDANGLCIYMNSEAEKLLGWTREEFIGKHAHNTIHTQTPMGKPLSADDCPILLETRMHGEVHMDDQVFVRKDGSAFPVALVSKASYSPQGELETMVVAFQDIAMRKEAEAEILLAKEAAEQASRIKGDFLANMSHEIRTPMNGIIGMTNLALNTQLNDEQSEYLGFVKSSADALLHIIDDILDFSKIESGHMQIEVIEFSLDTMLRDTMPLLAVRAHQKQLELLLHIAPDVPDRVFGDPGRLRQVIINLVGNAIKFTESGEIEVEVKRADATQNEHANLHFSVRDTGIGIPRDKLQTVFESFSQADTSTTRKYGGTGLGLSISTQIIKLMGGQISLESEVGKGSVFHFTLNMPVSSNHTLTQYQQTGRVEGMPVLVVDDNATSRSLLLEMLLNWKMLPTAVTNSEEALAELNRTEASGQPYTLAILDAQMPMIDGYELARRIKGHSRSPITTVIMLNADGRSEQAARCRELGINYLMKPVLQSNLFDTIMTALGMPGLDDSPQKVPALLTPSTLPDSQHQLKLLLAEDNLVNQKLAIRLLEKQGHIVTVANNGIEAVQHWQDGVYDAILMDVDMPEMNGFEAAQSIREQEKTRGTHIPIVAMTAHAMHGAREECLRHGMDGYLSKPIDIKLLWAELDKLTQNIKDKTGTLATQPSANLQTGQLAVVDFDKMRQTMDNNRELFDEITRLFLADAPPHLQRIKESLILGDVNAVRHSAHALKGMVSIFSAERTMQAADMVEQRAGQPLLAEAVAELEASLDELQTSLSAYQW